MKKIIASVSLALLVACGAPGGSAPADPYHQFDCLETPIDVASPAVVNLDAPKVFKFSSDFMAWCALRDTCDLWLRAAAIAPSALSNVNDASLSPIVHTYDMAQNDWRTSDGGTDGSQTMFDYACVTWKWQAYTWPGDSVTYTCPGKVDQKTSNPDAWTDFYGIGQRVRWVIHEWMHAKTRRTCHIPARLLGISCGWPQSTSTCNVGLVSLTDADKRYLCLPHVSNGACVRPIPPMH